MSRSLIRLPDRYAPWFATELFATDRDVPAFGEFAEKGLGFSHRLPPVVETDESEGSHRGSPRAGGGFPFVPQTVQSYA